MIDKNKLIDRFFSYVKIDTQSNPESESTPSTSKQWDLANLLVQQLEAMGLDDVNIDLNGYVMATLPSNVDRPVPTIGFIAHYDTTPDFTGTQVNPQRIDNYNGQDIVLDPEKNIVLRTSESDELLNYKGQTIITTDGNTLLGADDKAGITEIMEAFSYLKSHPEIKHGTLKIGFTPDEEIGRGAHKFDVPKFDAAWAYTMDGSQIGELEYENFNAASAKIIVKG
ncbi:MAG: peptidase T, partial [Leeuwenhoekiella sp.]